MVAEGQAGQLPGTLALARSEELEGSVVERGLLSRWMAHSLAPAGAGTQEGLVNEVVVAGGVDLEVAAVSDPPFSRTYTSQTATPRCPVNSQHLRYTAARKSNLLETRR
jgi:hypothetical protein